MLLQDHRDPVSVLIEESNPGARVMAHCELARRAENREDLSRALRHYREAVRLAPQDEQVSERVHVIEAHILAQGLAGKRRGMLRRLVGR